MKQVVIDAFLNHPDDIQGVLQSIIGYVVTVGTLTAFLSVAIAFASVQVIKAMSRARLDAFSTRTRKRGCLALQVLASSAVIASIGVVVLSAKYVISALFYSEAFLLGYVAALGA